MGDWDKRHWNWIFLLWFFAWLSSAIVVGFIFKDVRAGVEWGFGVIVALLAWEGGREHGVEQAREQRRKDDAKS